MDVFHVFIIVQIVLNRATHHRSTKTFFPPKNKNHRSHVNLEVNHLFKVNKKDAKNMIYWISLSFIKVEVL